MKYYFKVLQNYATFSGRARRKEYWMFNLFDTIFSSFFIIIDGLFEGYGALLYLFYVFAVFLPSIAVGVRRMHDVGKSGWFLLIPIYSFILTVTRGEKGENQYGNDPKLE